MKENIQQPKKPYKANSTQKENNQHVPKVNGHNNGGHTKNNIYYTARDINKMHAINPDHKREHAKKMERKKRKKKIICNFLIMIVGILFFLLIAWLLTVIVGKNSKPNSTSLPESITQTVESTQTSQLPSSQVSSAVESEQPVISAETWNTNSTLQSNEEKVPISPDYRMLSLPENGRVDVSYFNDVTFVGDSITQGLSLYEGTFPAKYCAYKNITPKGIYDGSTWINQDEVEEIPLDAIVASNPKKVYILIGANAIGSNTNEAFIQYYTEMLNQIKARLGDGVTYYIQSITPVRPDSKFDQNRINELNNLLAQLAEQQGVYFINLNEPLTGEDGYMKEEFAGYDGIHMLAPGYNAWVDYLFTHVAYNPNNPYLPSNPPTITSV